ncbi:MAG: TlpA family protein disulfide reductase [Verrucomicrobiaceae bacterium]|nr:TlpA family protein disulfide reductase [Verrucomicrobiaceae bacterium]
MRSILASHSRFPSQCAARLACLLLLLCAASAHASFLEWRNGEKAGGGILEANETSIRWQIDPKEKPFIEPVEVALHVLRSYELKPDANKDWSNDKPTPEPFSIRLDDGTRLMGSIAGMADKEILVTGQRIAAGAQARLAASAVTSIQRMNGPGLLLAGPGGRSGWTPDDESKKQIFRHEPGGYLNLAGWNRGVHHPVDLPDRVELRLRLRSEKRPEFRIEVVDEDSQPCIIETWEDDVVLQGAEGTSFATLTTLPKEQQQLTLAFFWDRQTGLCSLFDGAGKKITDFQTNAPKLEKPAEAEKEAKPAAEGGVGIGLVGAIVNLLEAGVKKNVARSSKPAVKAPTFTPGLAIMNKGVNLFIDELFVREWDGKVPAQISDAVPRVELTDGSVILGRIHRADASTFTIRAEKGSAETTLPWEKLLAAHHRADNGGGTWFTPHQARISYPDGMWAAGTLASLKKPHVTLRTSFATAPLTLDMQDILRIDLAVPAPPDAPKSPPLSQFDVIRFKGRELHGTLSAPAQGGPHPLWQLIGASKAVPIGIVDDVEITRAASNILPQPASALLYLKSGEILPGSLRAMDEKRIDFESTATRTRDYAAAEVQAVQFSGEPLRTKGFTDPGWRIVRGDEKKITMNAETGAMTMKPGFTLGHPSFSQVQEIRFEYTEQSFSAIRMRIFAAGPDRDAKGLNLIFGRIGNEAVFGLQQGENQLDDQNRINAPQNTPVRIAITEKTVEVSFNGVPMRRINITPEMRGGSGLYIESFPLWGNTERDVKISSFQSSTGAGRIAMPIVDPKAREHALLVPRFRKEAPPRHILVARNGDVLRGIIESATADHFSVRSGLETVRIPADRVSAAIWLDRPLPAASTPEKPEEKKITAQATATPATPGMHHFLLGSGGRMAFQIEKYESDAVMGKHPLLGQMRVPLTSISSLRPTAPEESVAMRGFRDWRLAFTPEPVLPETGGESSPLLGKDAPPVQLPLLAGGGDFQLAKERGKVVILDFWATWCGPCIKSLPELIAQAAELDSTKVRLVAVNQAEPKELVSTFLQTRGWKVDVVIDANQRISQQYGVEGIPHTVVIGPDGKVAYVTTGYGPDTREKLGEALRKLLK